MEKKAMGYWEIFRISGSSAFRSPIR